MKVLTSRWAVAALLILLVSIRWYDPYLVQIARLKTFDFYQLNEDRQTSSKIDIVQITDDDINEIGRWPWQRNVIANTIKKLHEKGAKIVVIPILFSEPDSEFINDLYLSENLSKVILSQAPSNQSSTDEGTRRGISIVGGDPTFWLEKYLGIVRPLPIFEEQAAGVGVVTATAEIDGVVRRIPLVVSINKEVYPTLSLETIRVIAGDVSYQMKTTSGGIDSVRVPKVGKIITDQNGRIWVKFNQTFNRYSLNEIDTKQLKDIVVLTLSAQGLATNAPTPLGLKNIGSIQASTIETLLSNTSLTRPLSADLFEILAIAVVGLFLILLIPSIKFYYAVPLFVATIAGMVFTGFHNYGNNTLIDFSFPLFTTTLLFLHLMYNNFASEYKQKLQIKKQFEHYVSPKLVKKLQQNPSLLKLGGETKELTILFSDLRGFTTLSETFKNDPQGLVKLVNNYLTPMTNIVQETDGTLDKYIGDAIMAFWNAPLDDTFHKQKCLLTAIKMFDELEKLNEELGKEGIQKLQIGIGINTGSVVVGNMGSNNRFDYTCIGDPVNLASRLEGQSKEYGVGIVIGAESVTNVKGYTFVPLDTIAVKGKKQGIKIYTIIKTTEKHHIYLADQIKFLKAYTDRNWNLAIKYAYYLSSCWNGKLLDYYNIMLERIERLKTDDPGPEWDGIYRAKTK